MLRADSEGKLPELKFLDISEYDQLQPKISDLVLSSAGWKQLTFLGAFDDEVFNVGPEIFCSLRKMDLSGRYDSVLKSRPWPKLEEIEVRSERMLEFVAENVKELFPALSIVRCSVIHIPPSLWRLYDENVFVIYQ